MPVSEQLVQDLSEYLERGEELLDRLIVERTAGPRVVPDAGVLASTPIFMSEDEVAILEAHYRASQEQTSAESTPAEPEIERVEEPTYDRPSSEAGVA